MTERTRRLRGISLILVRRMAGAGMLSPAWAGSKLATKKFVKKRIARATALLAAGIATNAARVEAAGTALGARLHDDPTIHSQESIGDSTTEQEATASCPTGKVAISGGAWIIPKSDHVPGVTLRANRPAGAEGDAPTGWLANAREGSPTSETWAVRAYVICVSA